MDAMKWTRATEVGLQGAAGPLRILGHAGGAETKRLSTGGRSLAVRPATQARLARAGEHRIAAAPRLSGLRYGRSRSSTRSSALVGATLRDRASALGRRLELREVALEAPLQRRAEVRREVARARILEPAGLSGLNVDLISTFVFDD